MGPTAERGDDARAEAPRRRWIAAPARDVALRIAAAAVPSRFDGLAGPAPPPAPLGLAEFQSHAVAATRAALARRRGAILADGVGLGKTRVALAHIDAALDGGGAVVVVAPAALRRMWSGALDTLPLQRRRRVTLLTHALLSRRAAPRPERLRLVVVDEAHAFRNPDTRRYRALARLCAGLPTLLLTATPVNNSPLDLHALLRLFAGDTAFRDLGVADLGALFLDASARTDPALEPRLLPVLREVLVRRSRAFVDAHYPRLRLTGADGSTLRFPRRAPPDPIAPALPPALVARVASLLDAFRGRAYAPLEPDATASAGRVALVRVLLLKRLDSSVAAFLATLRRQIRVHRAVVNALRDGFVPVAPPAETDPLQIELDRLVLRPLPAAADGRRLAAAVAADLERLETLRRDVAPLLGPRDPKLAALRSLLARIGAARAAIFTEYRDTARYLWRALGDAARARAALVDGSGARIASGRCSRAAVIERFAPRANAAPEPPPAERVDLLVATDVLSEGLNLQDAGHVISYELPWNPIRIAQRVGRIDRLGSPHDVVHAHHFLPDPALERLLRLADRVHRKIRGIRATVGDDGALQAPLRAGGTRATPPARHFPAGVAARLRAGDERLLADLQRADASAFDVAERLRLAVIRAGSDPPSDRPAPSGPASARAPAHTRPGPARDARHSPRLAATHSAAAARPGVIVACATDAGEACYFVDQDLDCAPLDAAACAVLLETIEAGGGAAQDGPDDDGRCAGARAPIAADGARCDDAGAATAADGALVARADAAARAVERFLESPSISGWRMAGAANAARPRVPRGGIALLVAARVGAALSAEPWGPSTDLCRRADALLARLREPLDAGTEWRLRDALRARSTTASGASPESRDAIALLDALDAALAAHAAPRHLAPSPLAPRRPRTRLVAALAVDLSTDRR